jgi:hypothetical protein
MERMIYVLQFKGQAGPVEGASGMLKATTSAPSCRVSTENGEVIDNPFGVIFLR